MHKAKSAKTESRIKLDFFETVHILLDDFECSTFVPLFMMSFQFFQIVVILLEGFEQNLNFSLGFFRYSVPHLIRFGPSYIYFWSVIGVSVLASVGMILGMINSFKLRGNKSVIFMLVTSYVYFFQYILFIVLVSFLLDVIKLCSASNSVLILGAAALCYLKLLLVQFFLNVFFFNFSFSSKDSFARMPSYYFAFSDVIRMSIFAIDVFVESESKPTILLITSSAFSFFLIANFISKLPYIKYEVTMIYFFLVCSFAWVNFSLFFTWIIAANIIKSNLTSIIVVGLVLIVGNFWYYFHSFFKYLVNLSILSISNPNITEKQIRYLYRMIQLSSKSKVDELMLASIIQVHIENCAKSLCVCKNRSILYDPISQTESDASVPIFKDPVFLKNFLLMLIQEVKTKFSTSINIQIVSILFQLEQFENFAQVSQELYTFHHRDKNLSFSYQICVDRISRKLKFQLKERDHNSQFAHDHIEDIFKFDRFSDRLKECIFDIVGSYSIFWDLLSERINEVKKISIQCKNIIRLKKEIKTLLKSISSITKESNVMISLIEFYFVYVISEPEKAAKFNPNKKQKTMVMKSFRLTANESTLNLFDESCFVFEVSIDNYSLGQIIWVSKNSSFLTSYEEKKLCLSNINSLMPKLISKNHNSFIRQYTKDRREKIIGNLTPLFILNSKKKLISTDILPKLIWNDNVISVITYFKVSPDKSRVVVSENGEVDSFGENFHEISKIDYENGFHMSNLSLFLMMPQLIVYFLPYFYGIKDFIVDDFDYDLLKSTYFIVYKDLNNKLVELSRLLFEKKKERSDSIFGLLNSHKDTSQTILKRSRDYCSKLYKYLSGLTFDMVKDVYHVKMDMNKSISSKADIKQEFWQLRILEYMNVTSQFKKEHFEAQFIFLNKINFDEELKYSLDGYASRHESSCSKSASEGNDLIISRSKKDLCDLRDVINKKKIEKVEETELKQDEMKKKATDIIKNLFSKSSDLSSKTENGSPFVRKMIRAVNVHNSKKNSKLITFIKTHIEKVPPSFDKENFCGFEILQHVTTRRKKNAEASFELHQHKRNIQKNISIGSVRSVSSTHAESDMNFIFKRKIKKNIRTKKLRLKLVILFFSLSVLVYLGMNVLIMINMENDAFLTFKEFLQYKFSKLRTIFIQLLSLTTYSYFNLQVTFSNLPDLRRFDLVDPTLYSALNTTNLYINSAFESLQSELNSFVTSSNFYNITSNILIIKELFVQSTWKLDNIDYISNLFQFIELYYSQLSLDNFLNREKAEESFFMENYDNLINSLVSYEGSINKNIASLFDDSMNSLLMYSLVL